METWEVNSLEELDSVVDCVYKKLTESNEQTPVLALHGDLGAGKTTFVQKLAKLMNIDEVVTSPTFVVMKKYVAGDSDRQLIHIDAYRIEEVDEMRVLGFVGLLAEKDTIICIEWAENIAELLPSHTYHLNFALASEARTITLTNNG